MGNGVVRRCGWLLLVFGCGCLVVAGQRVSRASAQGVAAQVVGRAAAQFNAGQTTLKNQAIEADWSVAGGHVSAVTVKDLWNHATVTLGEPFGVLLTDGTIYDAQSLRVDGAPQVRALSPDGRSARASDRTAGWEFTAPLTDTAGNIRVAWSVVLRDGSNYARGPGPVRLVPDTVRAGAPITSRRSP